MSEKKAISIAISKGILSNDPTSNKYYKNFIFMYEDLSTGMPIFKHRITRMIHKY